MVAIVTRAGKGSPLTNAEVDANFVNLNNGKLETSNNLSDLANVATARANLGLGTLSTLNSIAVSGDATGTSNGAGALALTLAASGVTAGTYGDATNIPQFAVDAKGRITSVSNVAVSIPSGSLTFTGDVTGSGSTGSSTALTLANSGVTAGTYTKFTVDAKGRVTAGASLASGDLPTYTGSLTSTQVTTALGFTPYNSSNPSGYITSSGSISGNAGSVTNGVYTVGNQTIAGEKSFSSVSTHGPIASVMAQNDTSASLEIRNNGGTGDSNLAMMRFHAVNNYGLKMGLRADGYFGIGGWSAGTWRWYLNAGNGDMVAAGNVTAYSDERLKKDWAELPDDLVERLAAVKNGTYTRIDTGARQVGVSAQSLRDVLPDAVGVGEDGDTLQVSYGNAALASAVKLAQRVCELTARLRLLEQKMGA